MAKELKRLELIVKETPNNKNTFYVYQVVEDGKVLCERKSSRKYVACAVTKRIPEGETEPIYYAPYYFGRLDLIGKGDSKNFTERSSAYGFAYIKDAE